MKKVIAEVLVFLFHHWRRDWTTALTVAVFMIIATAADLFMPVYSGHLVDVIVRAGPAREQSYPAALYAAGAVVFLGAVLIAGRQIGLHGICKLTTRVMTGMAADAYWRVQRFSSDWHANNFRSIKDEKASSVGPRAGIDITYHRLRKGDSQTYGHIRDTSIF